MLLYAQDAMETDKPWERWEIMDALHLGPNWHQCSTHPKWWDDREYRRKPEPEPMVIYMQMLDDGGEIYHGTKKPKHIMKGATLKKFIEATE